MRYQLFALYYSYIIIDNFMGYFKKTMQIKKTPVLNYVKMVRVIYI